MCAIQTFEQYEQAVAKLNKMKFQGTISYVQLEELKAEIYKQLKAQLFV